MYRQDLIDQASKAQTDARTTIDGIRTSDRLTDPAKADEIADIQRSVRDEVARLNDEHRSAMTSETERLRRKIATPAAGATGAERVAFDTSFRDALERARSVAGADSLMALFRDAVLVGDDLQQRAAMVVALGANHLDIVNAWLEEHPDARADVEALYELERDQHDVKRRFHRNLSFSGAV